MKIKFLVIFLSGIITISSVGLMWKTLEQDALEMNYAWSEYSTREVSKSEALSKIVNGFGYGGFIHHFKNYVIRQDSKYLDLAYISLEKTQGGINKYLSLGVTKQDAQRINDFQKTVDIYKQHLDIARKLILDSFTPVSVDKQVIVDDAVAINALNGLFKASKMRADKIQFFSEKHIVEIKNIYLAGFLSIISLLFVLFSGITYVVFKITKRSE